MGVQVQSFDDFRLFSFESLFLKVESARPPIQPLHAIKSKLCYEEEGPVSFEFCKIVILFQTNTKF